MVMFCNKIFSKIFLLVIVVILSSCSHNDEPLYRIQKNGLYGFIDSTGNVVIEPQYKYVGYFNDDGYATVITQVNYEFKKIKSAFNTDVDTLLVFKYGFIDKNNSLIVDTIHTIKLTKLQATAWGFFDTNRMVKNFSSNTNFLTSIYDYRIKLRAGLFVVQDPKTLLMGYMNIKGDTVIPAKYECVHPFYNGVARIRIKNEGFNVLKTINAEMLIDSLGKLKGADRYALIRDFTNSHTWASKIVENEDKFESFWYLLDTNGKVCSDSLWGDNIVIFNSPSDWYVYQFNFFGKNLYSFINKDGKFATDKNHDNIIALGDETFTDVTYMEDHVVGIKVLYNDTPAWAFADDNFEFKSQPFDSLCQFTENMAAVKEFTKSKIDSKWGFVDRNYKEVIPYKYDKVEPFYKGLAYFKAANIEGYINKRGDIVWSTEQH